MRHHDVRYWEKYLITDEKIWTVDGYFNPQNDRVRAKCKEDVESVERDKFQRQQHRMIALFEITEPKTIQKNPLNPPKKP